MPDYLAPGVYVAEVSSTPASITPSPTGVTGFVGRTVSGPLEGSPILVTNAADFEAAFGKAPESADEIGQFAAAVSLFFENGGSRLYVARISDMGDLAEGLMRLNDVPDIELVAAPGSGSLTDATARAAARQAVIDHCEAAQFRFAILAGGQNDDISEIRDARARHDTSRAAIYYPWLTLGSGLQVSPEGAAAGIYVRTDVQRGVDKAPANEIVRGVTGFDRALNKTQQEVLNPEGINALRFFEGRGNRVWGARTMSSDPEWKYVNVRRLMSHLERSLNQGLRWAAFEPNDERLWARVRGMAEDFLSAYWRDGALLGEKPEHAYFVRCDRSTMTQADIDQGRLICQVGVALLRPAEFVIFRVGQKTAEAVI